MPIYCRGLEMQAIDFTERNKEGVKVNSNEIKESPLTNDLTDNEELLDWVSEVAELTQPDSIMWITGDEAQLEQLRKEAMKTGELHQLNTCTEVLHMTLRELKAELSYAANKRTMRVPQTTGWIQEKCTKS